MSIKEAYTTLASRVRNYLARPEYGVTEKELKSLDYRGERLAIATLISYIKQDTIKKEQLIVIQTRKDSEYYVGRTRKSTFKGLAGRTFELPRIESPLLFDRTMRAPTSLDYLIRNESFEIFTGKGGKEETAPLRNPEYHYGVIYPESKQQWRFFEVEKKDFPEAKLLYVHAPATSGIQKPQIGKQKPLVKKETPKGKKK